MEKKGMKKILADWAKRTSKTWGQDCLFEFEDSDDEDEFYFKVDGFIYDAVNAVNGNDSFSFSEIFENLDWHYEFDTPSVLLVYKK